LSGVAHKKISIKIAEAGSDERNRPRAVTPNAEKNTPIAARRPDKTRPKPASVTEKIRQNWPEAGEIFGDTFAPCGFLFYRALLGLIRM
jgi:hypothetical protein